MMVLAQLSPARGYKRKRHEQYQQQHQSIVASFFLSSIIHFCGNIVTYPAQGGGLILSRIGAAWGGGG